MPTPTTPNRRTTCAALALGVVLAGLAMAPGCYRRVVSAKGLGADQYEVSEPYQSNSRVDNWLFGEQKRTDGKRAGSRLPQQPGN
jgi:hypothetical protein